MRREHPAWRRRALRLLLVIGFALQLPPEPAAAQTGAASRVEDALRATDEAIQRAKEVVREIDSQRAHDVLEHAVRVQGVPGGNSGAWGEYRRRRYAPAARMTAEARTLAMRAVTLAREDDSLRSRARREGEKATRALAHAREQVGGSPDPQIGHLLETAEEMIERAYVKFGEQRYQAALRLSVSAQQLVHQALGILGDSSVGGAPRVLRELERTDHLIERTRPLVEESGHVEALRLLERGTGMQAGAWATYREERFQAAMTGTREARSMVSRARALAQGPQTPEAVARALAETERLLEHAAEVVADSQDEQAAAFLERARNHQDRARRFLADGELRKALAETRLARSVIKRALRWIEREPVR